MADRDDRTLLLSRLSLRQLQILSTVAEHGSILHATRSMNMTQPAVSRAVIALLVTVCILPALQFGFWLLQGSSKQSLTDPLTELTNRRGLPVSMQRLNEASPDADLCALLIDVDGFKGVNDTLGHAAGDEVLQSFTVLVRGALRVDDVLGRIGGEEFAVMAVDADAEVAHALAERIRATVSESPIMWRETPIDVSVSIGVVVDPTAQRPLDDLLEVADRALYEAKRHGRNKVVLADEISDGPEKLSRGSRARARSRRKKS
mgnify:CR=1 FL=1